MPGDRLAIYNRRTNGPRLVVVATIFEVGGRLQVTTKDNPRKPLMVYPSTIVQVLAR